MKGRGRHFSSTLEEKRSHAWLARPVVWGAAVVACLLTEGVYLVAARWSLRIVLLVGLSCAVVALLAAWVLRHEQDDDASRRFSVHVFPVLLVFLGGLFLLFFPPRAVPDEDYHYGLAYSYANLMDPSMDEFEMRKEDFEFTRDSDFFSREMDGDYWEEERAGIPLFATHEGLILERTIMRPINFGANPPQLKLPAAFGVLVGRALNLSGVYTFYLGRLCNFAFGCLLIILAVRLTPIGRNAMMAVALLPMTLHLLGSYSYDVGIIGLSFLLTSLILRMAASEGRASARLMVLCLLVAGLLAPCKVLYSAISVLALFVPPQRFCSRRAMMAWKAGMLLTPVLVVLLTRMGTMVSMSGVTSTASTVNVRYGGEEGTFYRLNDVFVNPLRIMGVFLKTFFEKADFYYVTIVGGSLASFQGNIDAKMVQVFVCAAAVLASTIVAPGDSEKLSRWLRVASLGVFAFTFLGSLMALMLSWTFNSETVIEGVQGRYFLPVLPLLLLSMRGRGIEADFDTAPYITMVLGGLNCLYLAQIAFVLYGGASW